MYICNQFNKMAALRRLCGLFSVANNYYLKPVTSILNVNTSFRVERTCKFKQFHGSKTCVPWIPKKDKQKCEPIEIPEPSEEDEKSLNNILQTINDQLATNQTSRLFAIVAIAGKQFKVTENDLIIIQGYWPPNSGDKLKLEKVLLVGSTDFTLVGKPMLNRELANVEATVIEKTFSHTKTRFRMRKRKQYRRINFLRVQFTMLRINSINVQAPIDVKKQFEGLDRVY